MEATRPKESDQDAFKAGSVDAGPHGASIPKLVRRQEDEEWANELLPNVPAFAAPSSPVASSSTSGTTPAPQELVPRAVSPLPSGLGLSTSLFGPTESSSLYLPSEVLSRPLSPINTSTTRAESPITRLYPSLDSSYATPSTLSDSVSSPPPFGLSSRHEAPATASYETYQPVPPLQIIPIDLTTLVDQNSLHSESLAVSYQNYRLQWSFSSDPEEHAFFVLVKAFRDFELTHYITNKAVRTVRDDCQALEENLWTIEDKQVPIQSGKCADGNPTAASAQTYQVANLNQDVLGRLTENIGKLHALMYSNLQDIDSKCEVWSQLVMSRCVDLVNRSTTLNQAKSSDIVSLLPPSPEHAKEVSELKEYLDILLYFVRITPKNSSNSSSSNQDESSESASSASPSSVTKFGPEDTYEKFLSAIHECITYLMAVLLRNATPEDHFWIVERLIHTRFIADWGKEFLQMPDLIKSRDNISLPAEQLSEGAQFYVSVLRIVLSPILDSSQLIIDQGATKEQSLEKVREWRQSKTAASNTTLDETENPQLLILSESDLIAMLSQLSLGSFLSNFTDTAILELKTRLADAPGAALEIVMEFTGRAASVLALFEDIIGIISSSIPLFFMYPSCSKKLADMMVKTANRGMTFVSNLLTLFGGCSSDVASMIKSKAEQLIYRSFAVLIQHPPLWQFLVHLDLSVASLDLVSCLISAIYYGNPNGITKKQLNLIEWRKICSDNPALRSAIITRLTTTSTAQYLIYSLLRMLTTHLGSNDFVQVILFELFTLAYVTPETSEMQKVIRDLMGPIFGENPPLVSFLIHLTDIHLPRVAYGCFHVWRGLDLSRYQLPRWDAKILKRWLLAGNPDSSPEHHLAKYILASIKIEPVSTTSMSVSSSASSPSNVVPEDASEICYSELQRRLAMLIVKAHSKFVYPPKQPSLASSSLGSSSAGPPSSKQAQPPATVYRTAAQIATFTQFCSTLLLRTFQHSYCQLSAYPEEFNEGCVKTLAQIFTQSTAGQTCNIDPVSAFGLVELTGLTGAPSFGSLSTGFDVQRTVDICVRSFFDCGVPILTSLIAYQQHFQMGARLLFDSTIVVAPMMVYLEEFERNSDWAKSNVHATMLSSFANQVVLPFLNVPSLMSSMASSIAAMVRTTSNVEPPPLISLISAQFALCLKADRSFSSATNRSGRMSPFEDGPIPNDNSLDTSCVKTASLISFWLKSLLLIKDWFKIEKVLETLEQVFQLAHSIGLDQLCLDCATQCELYTQSLIPSKRASTANIVFPPVLTMLLGGLAKSESWFGSLFSTPPVLSVNHPWTLAFFLMSHARTINLEEIGHVASATLVPGASAPLSLSSLKSSFQSIQPLFDAICKAVLVLEPSHPAAVFFWNIFAHLYFAHVTVAGGQTLFFGHTLLLTTSSKSRRDKIRARITVFLNHYTAASSNHASANNGNSSWNEERRLRVDLRELFACLAGWVQIDLSKFTSAQALLDSVQMKHWFAPLMEKPFDLRSSWVQLISRLAPALQTGVTFLLFALQPGKQIMKLEAYMSTTKQTVDLMDLLKVVGLERLESIKQLRQDRKLQHSRACSDLDRETPRMEEDTPRSSIADSSSGAPAVSLSAGKAPPLDAFDLSDEDAAMKSITQVLAELRIEADNFMRRRQTHWTLLDQRTRLLQTLKRNQEQFATAKVPCKLGDQCKGPVNFSVQLSRIVVEVQAQNNLVVNNEQLGPMSSELKRRNQQSKANALVVRFLRTLHAIFGDEHHKNLIRSNNSHGIMEPRAEIPNESALIKLFWKLRDFHCQETINYAPTMILFDLVERQLLIKVASNNPLQVGPILYKMIEDPWSASQVSYYKDLWDPSSASTMERIHMFEYLWNVQQSPLLAPVTRASLLAKFPIGDILVELGDERTKHYSQQFTAMLKTQILFRSCIAPNTSAVAGAGSPPHSPQPYQPPHMIVDFSRDVQDPLFHTAVQQLGMIAGVEFPNNLGPVMQFLFDESRQRTIHPSAWACVLQLPYSPTPDRSGLTAAKLNSIVQFVSSYMEMFKNNNPSNFLTQWAPYMGKYLLLLKQIGFSLLHHLHMPSDVGGLLSPSPSSDAISSTKSPVKAAPLALASQASSSTQEDPSLGQRGESSDEPSSKAVASVPVRSMSSSSLSSSKVQTVDMALVNTYLDLYTLWIVTPSRNGVFEVWDSVTETVAETVAESLQQQICYLVIGPRATSVPAHTFATAYKRLIISNPSIPGLSSPKSPYVMTKINESLFNLLRQPKIPPPRALVLLRAKLENCPFSVTLLQKPYYMSTLQSIQALMFSVVSQPILFRCATKIFFHMLPETFGEFQNPDLFSDSLDGDTLSLILDMVFYVVDNLACPFDSEECQFFGMLQVLPWQKMSPTKIPTCDIPSSALSSLLKKAAAIPVATAKNFVIDLCTSAPPSNVHEATRFRVFQALQILRGFAHLPTNVSPNSPALVGSIGLESFSTPNPNEWRTADDAHHMGTVVARVFSSQSALLAVHMQDDVCLAVFASMMRYLGNLDEILYNVSASNDTPAISPEIRSILTTSAGISAHVPDSIAYQVLWSQILSAISRSILSLINRQPKWHAPPANGNDQISALSSRLIDIITHSLRERPRLTTIILPSLLSTIANGPFLALATETCLDIDWNSFRSFTRLSDLLTLPSEMNATQFRHNASKANCVVTLTVLAQQALQMSQQNVPALLAMEPAMHHWATVTLMVPGKEHLFLGLWMQVTRLYFVMIGASADPKLISAGQLPKQTSYPSQLLSVAKAIYARSEDKNSSSGGLLGFLGVGKSSAYSAQFRAVARLLAIFLFEHLVETPIFGSSKKIIGSNVILRPVGTYHIDEAQDKRKQSLLESCKRTPYLEHAPTINNVINYISRPQKSIEDLVTVWNMAIKGIFSGQQLELLTSILGP